MAQREVPQAAGRLIQDLTHGRPYVFVVMSYNSRWDFYERLKKTIEDETGLACLRADDVPGAGHDLLEKIHALIDRAEMIVAEISDCSPNVFYEIGYAVGNQKALLLVAEAGLEVPTDMKGREFIEYSGSRHAMEVFDARLRHHLRVRLGSRLALLRDMLEADVSRPAYIVSAPRYPSSQSRIRGQVRDRRTFGDNLGVVGLLRAFGAILGEDPGVELVSAQYCAEDLIDEKLNLYLIGSKKVNPAAGEMLARLQAGGEPYWYLGNRKDPEEGDYIVRLYRRTGKTWKHIKGLTEDRGEEGGIVHIVDYGLVVRAPHPKFPDRLVLIMAGAHSLGTGAACLAATDSSLIEKVRQALLPGGIDLADKRQPFWVLVRGEAGHDDFLDESGVTVVKAGGYSVPDNAPPELASQESDSAP